MLIYLELYTGEHAENAAVCLDVELAELIRLHAVATLHQLDAASIAARTAAPVTLASFEAAPTDGYVGPDLAAELLAREDFDDEDDGSQRRLQGERLMVRHDGAIWLACSDKHSGEAYETEAVWLPDLEAFAKTHPELAPETAQPVAAGSVRFRVRRGDQVSGWRATREEAVKFMGTMEGASIEEEAMPAPARPPLRIGVTMDGGLVQSVFSPDDCTGVEVMIIDYDTGDSDDVSSVEQLNPAGEVCGHEDACVYTWDVERAPWPGVTSASEDDDDDDEADEAGPYLASATFANVKGEPDCWSSNVAAESLTAATDRARALLLRAHPGASKVDLTVRES